MAEGGGQENTSAIKWWFFFGVQAAKKKLLVVYDSFLHQWIPVFFYYYHNRIRCPLPLRPPPKRRSPRAIDVTIGREVEDTLTLALITSDSSVKVFRPLRIGERVAGVCVYWGGCTQIACGQ